MKKMTIYHLVISRRFKILKKKFSKEKIKPTEKMSIIDLFKEKVKILFTTKKITKKKMLLSELKTTLIWFFKESQVKKIIAKVISKKRKRSTTLNFCLIPLIPKLRSKRGKRSI